MLGKVMLLTRKYYNGALGWVRVRKLNRNGMIIISMRNIDRLVAFSWSLFQQ